MPDEAAQEWVINGRITEVGRSALWDAQSRGIKLSFTHIILGRGMYVPTGREPEIPRDRQIGDKVPVAEVRWHNGYVNITANVDIDQDFDVGEIGIIVNENVLFSVISQPEKPLTKKVKTEQLLISFDVHFMDLPKELVNLRGPEQNISLSFAGQMAQIAEVFARQSAEIMRLREEVTEIRLLLAGRN